MSSQAASPSATSPLLPCLGRPSRGTLPLKSRGKDRHRLQWAPPSLPPSCLCYCKEVGTGSGQYLDPTLYVPTLSKLLVPEGLPPFSGGKDSWGTFFFPKPHINFYAQTSKLCFSEIKGNSTSKFRSSFFFSQSQLF